MEELDDKWRIKRTGLLPAYQVDFTQPIWQLRFDDVADLVGVECRDADLLKTSFWVFERTTGKLLLDNYNASAGWRASLADIRTSILFLQGLNPAGLGKHSGLMAINVNTGALRWQHEQYSFYNLTANQLLVLPNNLESAELIGLNIGTGAVVGIAGSIAQAQVPVEELKAQRLKTLQLPLHYGLESRYFATLSQFIYQKIGLKAAFALDYLETETCFAIGYYPETDNPAKQYWLALFSIAGELLLHEELGKELTGIGPDNFFIFRDTLILIKYKKSLVAYKV